MDSTAQCLVSAADAAILTEPCAMVSDADLYGIGIRLGFYFQWIITLIVTYNAFEYEMLHRTINIILQVGVFSVMLLYTSTGSLRIADAAVGFWLLFGSLSALSGNTSTYGLLSRVVRMAFYTLLSGYIAWLWFGGITQLEARPGNGVDGLPCETVVFFGRATAENPGMQGLARAAAIIGVLAFFFLMVRRIYDATPAGSKQEEKARQGGDDGPNGWLALLSVTLIIISIVAIEYLIRANQMGGMGGLWRVDQLIPFLIGLFGLLDTLLKIFIDTDKLRSPVWDLGSFRRKLPS
ncbi:uncharacterized protein B0H64DRAFT_369846 [Chaetomium fimeti]|uniref:Uncharacterized protein n=1 Tax=Chaetomium fimeti TaxID=1854472 RepID=A0AAE0HQ29_9PEZI|nr:hypothetical protein B0H64DRAFT_369846 [Chaetomium fimeti]